LRDRHYCCCCWLDARLRHSGTRVMDKKRKKRMETSNLNFYRSANVRIQKSNLENVSGNWPA
jgi:hypothetical protein